MPLQKDVLDLRISLSQVSGSELTTDPGRKIIDCGPVGPLMMDLSPSCWEGPSPSHFKGPGALALSMDQVHHIAKGLKSIPH